MKGSVLALLEKPGAGQGILYHFQTQLAGVSSVRRGLVGPPFVQG